MIGYGLSYDITSESGIQLIVESAFYNKS